MFKTKPNIAVTGLQMMDNPYPGISCARSLKEEAASLGSIIGLSYDLNCTGNFSPFFDDVFLTPFPWDSQTQWLERIQQIHKKIPLDIIIPTLDSEIVLFSNLAPTLLNMGIHTLLPSETSVKSRSKNYLSTWCKTHHIKTPKTLVITDKSELDKIAGTVDYPCYIKGAVADAYLAYNFSEARVFFDRIYYTWGLPIIIQEQIRGEDFDVAGVANRESDLVCGLAIKKLSTTDLGKCSFASTIVHPELLELTKNIAKSLHWTGPLEAEFVYDSFNREFYLFEINARFPAWIYLSAQAKYNLPFFLVRLIMGEAVKPSFAYEPGLLFFRTKSDYFFEVDSYSQLAATGELRKGEFICETI